MNIKAADPNFKPQNSKFHSDIVWNDVRNGMFDLYGLYAPCTEPVFRRMPYAAAEAVSAGVAAFASNTSGGRIRFCTDSPYVALLVEIPSLTFLPTMPATGTSGFDLYIRHNGKFVFLSCFRPGPDTERTFSGCVSIGREYGSGLHELLIYFPLYNDVTAVRIGTARGAKVLPGGRYRAVAPFVYYGSSITQGACASRPGNCYQGFISRRFDTDYINYGFSGHAKGERRMASYIAQREMSLFVCDYDHNAPDPAHLAVTHYDFYEEIRRYHPDIPYIMVSRPDIFGKSGVIEPRCEVIGESLRRALEGGDKNVCLINGEELFYGADAQDCTVDDIHPNDLGLWRMAQVIGEKIAEFGF